MPNELTPEEHLCLLLARGDFTDNVSKRAAEQIGAGLRWDRLVERAAAHGLIPLVYHRLRALDYVGVPPPVHRQLKDIVGINAIRNELFAQELVRVLTRLGEAGVAAIPLKGIFLAESLYGDATLRTCADLDILIQPQDLPEGLRLLRSLGYSDRLGGGTFVRLLSRYGKDCALMREEGRSVYPLQVHCGLIWGGPAEERVLGEIWSTAVAKPFHAALTFGMSPEWEFLYLAVHAARHRLYPFKWLVDLDWLSVRGAVDWKEVHAKAQRLGWDWVVLSCLAACAELLGTPIPGPFAEVHAPTRGKARFSAPGHLAIPRETLFAARLIPSPPQRLQFLAVRVFVPTPADGELLRLPSPLFFLYYFLRPVRLSFTVAGWLIRAGWAKLRRLLGAR